MLKAQYVYLIFSRFMVGKTKINVLIFSISIILLSLYLNNPEKQLEIHKRQTMIPQISPLLIFEEAKCFLFFTWIYTVLSTAFVYQAINEILGKNTDMV